MMMAHDSTPGRPELSPKSVEELREALQRYLTAPDETALLRPTLRRIAQEAHEREMHAEQLLVVLKDIWFSLPAIRAVPEGELQMKLLQRAVTLCIREYYEVEG